MLVGGQMRQEYSPRRCNHYENAVFEQHHSLFARYLLRLSIRYHKPSWVIALLVITVSGGTINCISKEKGGMMNSIKNYGRGGSTGQLNGQGSLADLVLDVIEPSRTLSREPGIHDSGVRSDSARPSYPDSLSQLRPAKGSFRVGFREFLD